MKKKGQLLTIDFIFSLILFMLALSYTIRVSEADIYRQKEEAAFNDLKRIGSGASERMIAGDDFICKPNNNPYFNCVVGANFSGNQKSELGIPASYDYSIEKIVNLVKTTISSSGLLNSATTGNFYSEKRSVIWFDNPPTTDDIEDCSTTPSCTDVNLMITVWKT